MCGGQACKMGCGGEKGDISSVLLDKGIADSRDTEKSGTNGRFCSFYNPRTCWKYQPLKQVILDISLEGEADLIVTCNPAENGRIRGPTELSIWTGWRWAVAGISSKSSHPRVPTRGHEGITSVRRAAVGSLGGRHPVMSMLYAFAWRLPGPSSRFLLTGLLTALREQPASYPLYGILHNEILHSQHLAIF